MANDSIKAKADSTPKEKATPAPKEKTDSTPKEKTVSTPKDDGAAKNKGTSGEDASKAKPDVTSGAAPANYSRGEGQKPVTAAYKENWNAIFAKKKAKKKKRS